MNATRPPDKPQRSGRFSIIPARAIDDPRLGKAALVVLCALGTYSNRDGWCWPSTKTLCQRLRLTRRPVTENIRQLQELEYIEIQARFNEKGQQQSNKYRVLHDADLPADLWDKGGAGEQHPGMLVSSTPGGAGEQHPERTKKERTKKHTVDSSPAGGFEEFWRAYPSRKPHPNPKAPAKKKYEGAINRGVPPADIIRGANNFALYVEHERLNPKYVVQAQTWLSQERWSEHQEAAVTEPTPIML